MADMMKIVTINAELNSAKEFNAEFSEVASWLHKRGWRFKTAVGRMSKKGVLKENAVFEDGEFRIVIFGVGGRYDSSIVLELDKLKSQG